MDNKCCPRCGYRLAGADGGLCRTCHDQDEQVRTRKAEDAKIAKLKTEMADVISELHNYELNGSDAAAQIRGIYADFDIVTAELSAARKRITELEKVEVLYELTKSTGVDENDKPKVCYGCKAAYCHGNCEWSQWNGPLGRWIPKGTRGGQRNDGKG
jgi:hypothetical protein